MNLPFGLSALDISPFWVREQARDAGNNVWETEDADPYWQGRATTSKLSHDRLQDAEGFIDAAVMNRTPIDLVDPVYYIPAAYRLTGLPVGFTDGLAAIVNLTDPLAPVISGLPIGLVLKRGDRLSFRNDDNLTCHRVTADTVVASHTAQAVPVVPPALPNVFDPGDDVMLLNPAIRINIVTNSWSAPRVPQHLTVASFMVEEAGIA